VALPVGLAGQPHRRLLTGNGLDQAIERNGDQNDGSARFQRGSDLEGAQSQQDIESQSRCADHRGDDQHVHRRVDVLVDAEHQRRLRRWDEDAPQLLPARATGHDPKLAYIRGNLLQAKRRVANHRRHRIHQRSKHGRDRIVAKEHQLRHQIGECRRRLCQIEQRYDEPLVQPRCPIAEYPDHCADGDADRNRDHHERQGLHGACPLIEEGEIEAGDARKQSQPRAAESIGDDRQRQADAGPGQRWQPRRVDFAAQLETSLQEPEGEVERNFKNGLSETGDRLKGVDEKIDSASGPCPKGHDPFVGIGVEPRNLVSRQIERDR
jgi:hypothetical protein